MDSSNYPQPSSNHERNAAKNDSAKRPISNATYRQQTWSFPDSIIYYITKNPSTPKCYEKVIQSCKRFFIKNPILFVSNLALVSDENFEWHTQIPFIFIDQKNVKTKIWTTDMIGIRHYDRNTDPIEHTVLSSIIPRFYRSDIAELKIQTHNIYFTHLKFLASSCHKITLDDVIVMNEDDTIVALEKIIKIFPKLIDFKYSLADADIITSNTVQELLRIPHFYNFTKFELYFIPESFDIVTFYDYIKKNKKTKLSLEFFDWLHKDIELSEAYKNYLQQIVDEILEDESREYKAPHISFPDNDYKKVYKLWCLANPKRF